MTLSGIVLKRIALALVCLPAAWLTIALFTHQLGANPVETLLHQTGQWALRLLVLTLAVTPLVMVFAWPALAATRRVVGVAAFLYGLLHALIYVGLEQQFDGQELWKDVTERPYITFGFSALCLLLPLALTSNRFAVRQLGHQRWKQWHQLHYVSVVLVCWHFLLSVKADLREPLIYSALVLGLLLFRAVHQRQVRREKLPVV